MTSRTVIPIQTGSPTPPNVACGANSEKALPQPWLRRYATRVHWSPNYARKKVFSDDALIGLFPQVAAAVEEMLRDGRGELVGLRCAELDAVRAAYQRPVLPMDDALLLETQTEGWANDAQQAYSVDRSPGALDTMVRRWEKQKEVLTLAILAARHTRVSA